MRIEIPPRLARRLRATGHCHRLEASQSLVSTVVGQQELATPKRAIVSESESIERNTEDGRCFQRVVVFGQTSGDVGMMVLHLDERQPTLLRPRASEL